jgi:SHS2 domain-containing protein
MEHPAELALEIEAPSEAVVFSEALAAYAELLGDARGRAVTRRIELTETDRAALLAEWLDELVYLSEVEQFVPERVTSLELDGAGLQATVRGRRGSPRPLVKAVTRHRLELRPEDDGWFARVVLDV